MKLRDGEITLSQLINKIEYQKDGKFHECLDDLRPILDPAIFIKPDKNMVAAFNDVMLEQKLWK